MSEELRSERRRPVFYGGDPYEDDLEPAATNDTKECAPPDSSHD